jgi:hypothetical protein
MTLKNAPNLAHNNTIAHFSNIHLFYPSLQNFYCVTCLLLSNAALSCNRYEVGDFVSTDQFICKTPGQLSGGYGWSHTDKCNGDSDNMANGIGNNVTGDKMSDGKGDRQWRWQRRCG